MRQLTSSSTQNQQPLAGPSTNYPGSSSKKKKKNRKKETSTTPPRGDKGSGASPLPPNSSTLLSRWTQKVTGIASSCGVSLSSTGASLSSEDQLHDKYDVDMMSISSPDPNGSGSNKKPPRRATNSQPQQQPATAPHSTDVTAPTTTFATNVTATHNNNAGNTDPNGMVDHATLATATTASATTWCDSADDYDAVVEENEGMEVVMSSSAAAQGSDLVMMMATSAAVAEEKTARTSTSSRKATSATITSVPQQPKSFRVPRPQDPPYQTHSFSAGKHVFTVDQRYSMIRMIGSGAYGVVISATDAVQHSNVAIKMIPKAFQDEIDAKRILREIKLLKHFQHHDNICNILDMMPPNVEWLEDFTNVYMVTELMETDLHRIIYSKQKLSIDHVQYFVYQILRGLLYIHSCEVLHRDLKPSNLLVNSNCDLKICDFGLARGIGRGSLPDEHNTMLLTEYVVTRWYRAPEIMLACHEYSYPIDVWSVGCIFGELILRKPLFPGDDYIDQLTIICEKLGKVPEADLDFVTSEKAKRFMRKLPNKVPTHLSLVFPGTPLEALDAMRKMLEIHPSHRLTVPDALRHPFFEPLHNPLDEPVSSRVFDFGFESEKLHRLRLKELIWEEVGDFRPSCLPAAPSKLSQQRRGGGMMEEDTAAKKDP